MNRSLCSTLVATLLVGLFLGTAPAAERPGSPADGGRFQALVDSLGYDGYRQLSRDRQLDRREDARRWLKRAREHGHAAAGEPTAEIEVDLLKRALDACATAVGYCPYLPDAWLLYARFLNELGRYDSAAICLDHAGITLPYERRDDERRDLEGDYHRQRAVVAYNRVDFSTSVEEARLALEIRENDAELRLLLARSLGALEQFDEAREILDSIPRDRPERATALAVLGLVEMQAGNLDAAREAFDAAEERGMRGAVFWNDRGRLALELGEYDEAAESFERAIDVVPGFMEARSNLAVAHRRAGRLQEAERVLRELVVERPDYAPGHFNLAETIRAQLDDLGPAEERARAEEALEHYSQALATGFDVEQVLERRATLAARAEYLEVAEEDFLEMSRDPGIGGEVLHRLGRVKREQGRADIAQNLFEMAIERGFEEAIVYSDLGGVLLAQARFAEARDALARAVELDPRLVVTRVNLSIAWMELGDLEEADRALAEAEERAPDLTAVREQREQIDRLRGEED